MTLTAHQELVLNKILHDFVTLKVIMIYHAVMTLLCDYVQTEFLSHTINFYVGQNYHLLNLQKRFILVLDCKMLFY